MKASRPGRPDDMGSVPIGYTTAVTPMQMLDVFTTVANGGVTRPPRLVDATIDADGAGTATAPMPSRRVIVSRRPRELNEMLRGVVTDGTGDAGRDPGLHGRRQDRHVAQAAVRRSTAYMASFAGFAPAESPRLAAIVVIDQPARPTDTSAARSPRRCSPRSCSTRSGSSTCRRRRDRPRPPRRVEPGHRRDRAGSDAAQGRQLAARPRPVTAPVADRPAGNVSQPVP